MDNNSKPNETADEALKQIVDGFNRFRNEVYPEQQELFKKLAHEQTPRAMFITCADSRVAPELITQSATQKSPKLLLRITATAKPTSSA